MLHLNKYSLLPIFTIISISGLYTAINNWSLGDEIEIYTDESSQIIEDSIDPYCNGINYYQQQNVDFGNINSLEIDIFDREGWYTNLFELSLEKTGGIEPKYRDDFEANVILNLTDDAICNFSATVRISGDKKDHINSDLMSSLDVKLLTGNIFGITKFKLFLPNTRNNDNEIVVTTLLEEIGFISPRSFYVDVGILNWSNQFTVNKYIFQEKQSKEMIEHNYFREGPLIETNESFYWDFLDTKVEDPALTNPLFIGRIINKYWSKKNINSAIITLEALEVYNQAIFNSYMPSKQINYSYLGDDEDLFFKFDAANFALLNDHAITTHQRKFFFDKINNQFHPIYYDGNSNFLELGHIRWREDYLEYPKLYKAAAKLYEEININRESFNKKLNNRGLNINKEESDALVDKFLNNLNNISNQTSDKTAQYKNFSENNKSIFYPDGLHFLFYNFKTNTYEICLPDLSKCFFGDNYLNFDEVFSNKIKVNNKLSYLIGVNKNSFLENINQKLKYMEIDKKIILRFYGQPKISINKDEKQISLNFLNEIDRVVIEGEGVLDGWTIDLLTNLENLNTETTYDENLLTGCLTLNNLKFENLSINAKNMHCEDAVNIINSEGSLKDVDISNSKFDGLDIDFSTIFLNSLNIVNSFNDCFDLSSGNYTINSVDLDTCFDKGLSIGEKSNVNIINIRIQNSKTGLAVKDSSKVIIENFESKNNEYCLLQYRKKQEFGPSYTSIRDFLCDSQVFIQKGSVFENE